MTVTLAADVEKIVSAYLRSRSEVTALVSDRVYTEIPSDATVPLVVLNRLGGAPVRSRQLWLDSARLQFDCYGGSKKTTLTVAETVRACLWDAATATHTGGTVTAVTFGELLWLPDETWLTTNGKARPRYLFDATVTAHP